MSIKKGKMKELKVGVYQFKKTQEYLVISEMSKDKIVYHTKEGSSTLTYYNSFLDLDKVVYKRGITVNKGLSILNKGKNK